MALAMVKGWSRSPGSRFRLQADHDQKNHQLIVARTTAPPPEHDLRASMVSERNREQTITQSIIYSHCNDNVNRLHL